MSFFAFVAEEELGGAAPPLPVVAAAPSPLKLCKASSLPREQSDRGPEEWSGAERDDDDERWRVFSVEEVLL